MQPATITKKTTRHLFKYRRTILNYEMHQPLKLKRFRQIVQTIDPSQNFQT